MGFSGHSAFVSVETVHDQEIVATPSDLRILKPHPDLFEVSMGFSGLITRRK